MAETLAGLLAAAAPVATRASSSSSWAISLLKDALGGSTLEMSDAWSAAVWYVVDHLLEDVAAAGSSSGSGGDGGNAAGTAAMEVEELGGAAASPAAVTLQQVLSTVLTAVPGAAAAAVQQHGGAAPAASSTAGALTSDVKRLKYLLSCLPPVRRLGVVRTTGTNLLTAAAADSPDTGQQPSAATVETTATATKHPAGYVASSEGITCKAQLPKSVRVFLAAVMHEMQGLLEVEQPTAMREAIGSLLADLAGIFSAPEPLLLPQTAAAAARPSNGGSSGCSSPVEIEVPAAGDAAQGLEGRNGDDNFSPEVVLLSSSISGLRSQAAKLLQQTVSRFATHTAFLETLKSSGSNNTPSGSSSNLAAAGGSGVATPPHRGSNNSDDVVMVEAADASGPGTASGLGAGLSVLGGSNKSGPGNSPSTANLPALAKSLTQCGIGLQMIIAMVDSGESATLRPLLLALLPGVLALQELSGPGVQQLASEAKGAFVLYKYLPFGPGYVDAVGQVILGCGGSDAWSTRAAALVFLQVFWFRHCYLQAQQGMEQLQVSLREAESVISTITQ